MKCVDLLALLNEYVDGELEPSICEEWERHLADCYPCRVVVDNVRGTITLYKEDRPYDVPEAFRRRLHDLLRSRWPARAR
jgi:anti-sigma factor RsiW